MNYLLAFFLGFFSALIFFPLNASAGVTSDDIKGRTFDEQIAIINGQNPDAKNAYGVRVINGQTGNVRRESAFARQTRELCAKVYKDDHFGAMLCRDLHHRVRERQYDRYYGLDD